MIYLLDQNSSVHPMTESKYDQEADLQELIMRNPNLVLRDPNENGANLFMVSREYAIDESADGSNTFSLDLLLLDQSGTPVLVEVKRSLFAYYKNLYEELGLYDQYRLRIHKYLVATAET